MRGGQSDGRRTLGEGKGGEKSLIIDTPRKFPVSVMSLLFPKLRTEKIHALGERRSSLTTKFPGWNVVTTLRKPRIRRRVSWSLEGRNRLQATKPP